IFGISLLVGFLVWFSFGAYLALSVFLLASSIFYLQFSILQKMQDICGKVEDVLKKQDLNYGNIQKKEDLNYKQLEASIALFATQQFSLPLPGMRGSVISPDFANIVISEVNRKRPELVVECGSGVSTIITANCLKKINRGHIFSVDHEEKYAEITRNNLQLHDLDTIQSL
ncbi:MAG: hypothetical protein HY753_02115, partial [Nitrospirae bacterium]|nr:hypothetical protein [Nitrospirota bacterium]